MPVYARRLSREWKQCFEQYENLCGFEPMYQDDIDKKETTPKEAWDRNITWLEDVVTEIKHIKIPLTT